MGYLQLHWERDGPRYYLEGEPLQAGDIVEAWTHDGRWTLARFEYTWDSELLEIEPFLLVPKPDGGHQLLDRPAACRWPNRAHSSLWAASR